MYSVHPTNAHQPQKPLVTTPGTNCSLGEHSLLSSSGYSISRPFSGLLIQVFTKVVMVTRKGTAIMYFFYFMYIVNNDNAKTILIITKKFITRNQEDVVKVCTKFNKIWSNSTKVAGC